MDRGAASRPARAPWTDQVEPVFLVGCARSGTTWLQAMLASHPEVHTGPETHFFATYHPVELEFWRTKDRRLGLSEYLTPEALFSLIGDSFWRVVSALPEPDQQPRYFLEKSPHHCLSAQFILNTFPGARFVHLVRDCRAVVASLLRISPGWGKSWAPQTVTDATNMWLERVRASQEIKRHVRRSEQYVELRYEDLRNDPQEQLSILYKWLGLTADPALLQSAIESNSLESVRTSTDPFSSIPLPGGTDGAARGGVAYPEGFVGPAPCGIDDIPMNPSDRELVEELAGELLHELGYPVALASDHQRSGTDAAAAIETRQDQNGLSDRGHAGPSLPLPPMQPTAFAVWLGSTEARRGIEAGALQALAEAGPAPDREASVLVIGEGDEPHALLQTLAGLAQHWQDDWELVLASRQGTACEAAALHLEGDFQLIRNAEPVTYEMALNQAALAARGRHLVIHTAGAPYSVPRDRFLQLGGARKLGRAMVG